MSKTVSERMKFVIFVVVVLFYWDKWGLNSQSLSFDMGFENT